MFLGMSRENPNANLSRELVMLIAKRPVLGDGEARSQRWLAARSGLNLSTLNLIISGERECGRAHLKALCAAFDALDEKMGVLIASLQDELEASGVDPSRVLIRNVDGVDLDNLHLSPAFNEYLGIISRRLAAEAASGDDLFSAQVEWLSRMIARVSAHEADGGVVPFSSATVVVAAEHKAPYDGGPDPTKLKKN